MIDKVFYDELFVYPKDMVINNDVKASLEKDVIRCFLNPTIVEEKYTEVEEFGSMLRIRGLMRRAGLRLFQDGGGKWIRGKWVTVPRMIGRIEKWLLGLSQNG